MRVLIVEDEPYMAEAVRDGLRLEAIAADIAGDGDTALELLGVNSYDLAVPDPHIPGPPGRGASGGQPLRPGGPGPRHPRAFRRRGRPPDRRVRQRHPDPHAHRRRPD